MMEQATALQLRQVDAAARRILSDIAGVRVVEVAPHSSNQPATISGRKAHVRHERGAQVMVMGWSASLHGRPIKMRVRDMDNPEPEIAAFASSQARRAREGLRLGSKQPFHCRDADTTEGPFTQIDHLKCDRAGLAILLEQNGHDHGKVAEILRQNVEYANGDRYPMHSLRGIRLEPNVVRSGMQYMCDNMLIVTQVIPETVVCHLPGKRLGDVADIHEAFADRTIKSAQVSTDDTCLTCFILSSDYVRIGEHLKY